MKLNESYQRTFSPKEQKSTKFSDEEFRYIMKYGYQTKKDTLGWDTMNNKTLHMMTK